jgi:flagellar motility protein MotE (MotC chaperone)
MLNPLDALSLTSTILTFIDFTGQVILKTKEIYESGTDLESVRIRSEARDLKGLSEDLSRREKLLSIIPAEEISHGPGHGPQRVGMAMGGFDLVLAAKREKKFRKAKQELHEVENRLETRKRLADLNQKDLEEQQKRLNQATDELFRSYDDLKSREMPRFSNAARVVKGEEVPYFRSHSLNAADNEIPGSG